MQVHNGIVICTVNENTRQNRNPQGYPESLRKRAAEMCGDGMNLRNIARHLKVHHRTVGLWGVDHAEALPNAPMPDEVQDTEMDELFTFIGDKKVFISLRL